MSGPLLEVRNLSRRFGRVSALSGFDLGVEPQKIHAIIGPNGAGKTTFFNLVTGLLGPDAGSIRLDGVELISLPSYRRTALGISRTFQNIRLFGSMTVLENVMLGQHCRARGGLLAPVLAPPFRRPRTEGKIQRKALALLDFVGLREKASQRAVDLPYGDQRLVEIARALATEPRLLLLDEPAAGTNPHETEEVAALIRKINRTGVTVLLIEHKMSLVMGLSEVVTVLNFGEKIAEGAPTVVQRNPRVIEAYLGAE